MHDDDLQNRGWNPNSLGKYEIHVLKELKALITLCVCVCSYMRACARACARVHVCVCVLLQCISAGGKGQ